MEKFSLGNCMGCPGRDSFRANVLPIFGAQSKVPIVWSVVYLWCLWNIASSSRQCASIWIWISIPVHTCSKIVKEKRIETEWTEWKLRNWIHGQTEHKFNWKSSRHTHTLFSFIFFSLIFPSLFLGQQQKIQNDSKSKFQIENSRDSVIIDGCGDNWKDEQEYILKRYRRWCFILNTSKFEMKLENCKFYWEKWKYKIGIKLKKNSCYIWVKKCCCCCFKCQSKIGLKVFFPVTSPFIYYSLTQIIFWMCNSTLLLLTKRPF